MQTAVQLPIIANEAIFESFIVDLFNLQHPNSNFQRFGKKGNKQHGIDIISTATGIAIQCKKKEGKSRNLLNELKADITSDLEKLKTLGLTLQKVIFVSTFDDNAHLIAFCQKIKTESSLPFDITYMGWQSLSEHAQNYPPILRSYFPQFYNNQPKSQLNKVPYFDSSQLLGREEVLRNIEALANTSRVFVVQGVGGIGKTVVLATYVEKRQPYYDNILWIESGSGALKQNITSQLVKIPNLLNTKKEYPKWDDICRSLYDIEGRNLLVIDGIESVENEIIESIEDLADTKWQIIITSRSKIADFPTILVEGLSKQQAKTLFVRYFQRKTDDKILDKILVLLENHPLLVELIAKAAHCNSKLTLAKLHSTLSKRQLNSVELQRVVNIGRHGRKYAADREQTVLTYLLICFDISSLTKAEQKQLLYFSVFPISQPIDFNHFLETTKQQKQNVAGVENSINRLTKKGWISSRNGAFYLHPLIQLIAWQKLMISADKLSTIISHCSQKLAAIFVDNPWSLNDFLAIAKNILDATDLTQETIILSCLYASALTKMGNDEEAIYYFEKCLGLVSPYELLFEPDFSISFFGGIAHAYKAIGSLEKAIVYDALVLTIYKIHEIDEPIGYARALDNYATTLDAMGRQAESVAITKKVIKLFKRENSKKNLCQAYTNLANTYLHMASYSEAKYYWKKGFELLEPNYEDGLRSSSYNTIGAVLFAQKRSRLAIQAFIKGIRCHNKSPNPLMLSTLYCNLASAQLALHQLQKAKQNIDKAFQYSDLIPGNLSNLVDLYAMQANYYIKSGNFEAAENSLQTSLQLSESIHSTDNLLAASLMKCLRTNNAHEYFMNLTRNELFNGLCEYMCIFNNLFKQTINRYGILKAPTLKEKGFLHDYVFFCTTKASRTMSSIYVLIKKEKAEDAMILLHSVYRIYATITFLIKHPSKIDTHIDAQFSLSDKTQNQSTSQLKYFTQNLPEFVENTSYPEDKIVHSHFDPHLSDHVHSSILTLGNYTNETFTALQYDNKESLSNQPAHMGVYLQILLLHEICLFLNQEEWNKKTAKFLSEGISLLISMMETLSFDDPNIKPAIIARLRKCYL